MADKQNDSRLDKNENSSPPPSAAPKPLREIEVPVLDEPPSLGKERIHPRRPARIVPTREERISQEKTKDKATE